MVLCIHQSFYWMLKVLKMTTRFLVRVYKRAWVVFHLFGIKMASTFQAAAVIILFSLQLRQIETESLIQFIVHISVCKSQEESNLGSKAAKE